MSLVIFFSGIAVLAVAIMISGKAVMAPSPSFAKAAVGLEQLETLNSEPDTLAKAA